MTYLGPRRSSYVDQGSSFCSTLWAPGRCPSRSPRSPLRRSADALMKNPLPLVASLDTWTQEPRKKTSNHPSKHLLAPTQSHLLRRYDWSPRDPIFRHKIKRPNAPFTARLVPQNSRELRPQTPPYQGPMNVASGQEPMPVRSLPPPWSSDPPHGCNARTCRRCGTTRAAVPTAEGGRWCRK